MDQFHAQLHLFKLLAENRDLAVAIAESKADPTNLWDEHEVLQVIAKRDICKLARSFAWDIVELKGVIVPVKVDGTSYTIKEIKPTLNHWFSFKTNKHAHNFSSEVPPSMLRCSEGETNETTSDGRE